MPHLYNNIPLNIYHVSIGSEILIFARITSDNNVFMTFSNQYVQVE